MSAAVATDDLAALRAEVQVLKRENKRLTRALNAMEDRAEEAEEELGALRDEASREESANHQALAHTRMQLENLVAKIDADLVAGLQVSPSDVFAHLMNRRAIDAITELIGR